MPIYEYDCQSCKKRTEAIQRVGERPLRICPHCGGKLKKAFSAPAIPDTGDKTEQSDQSDQTAQSHKSDQSDTTKKPKATKSKAPS